MLNRTALTAVVAAALAYAAPSIADTGSTPDGNRRPVLYDNTNVAETRREFVLIGRHAQMFNPGNVLRVREAGPYALSGDTDVTPRGRVQVIHVGSRQVPVGITYDR
jgi:hypothetical protein